MVQNAERVEIKIVSNDGKLMSANTYNLVAGNNLLPLNTTSLKTGVYTVVIAGKEIYQRLIFSKL